MMKHAVLWVILLLPLLSFAQAGAGDEIAFRGSDILLLARTIAAEGRRTNQLPAAYQLTMTNDHPMIISASNTFELLSRAIDSWRNDKAFPRQVVLRIADLKGPALDAQYEPKRAGLTIAVPTQDIGNYATIWLKLVEAPGHTIPKVMKFEAQFSLTAAQIVVAMAVLIDETAKQGVFPAAIAIPLVASPSGWQDTRTPLIIAQERAAVQDEPPAVEADLRLTINGIELGEDGPVAHGNRVGVPPFCGIIRLELTGYGPVTAIRLQLDGLEKRVYTSNGPHVYKINTLPLRDGLHTVSATMTDARGKNYAYVFAFTVANGRQSTLNPAEKDAAAPR